MATLFVQRDARRRAVGLAAAVAAACATVAPTARATWNGAKTGTTNDAAHTYTLDTNWQGGTIDDSFNGVALTGATTLYFAADRATVATGLNLGYTGNFDLTLQSSDGTTRTLTLNGDIGGDFGGTNDRTVNLGASAAPLVLDLNGATRTFAVTDGGDVLNLANAVTNSTGTAGITKTGGGRLNLTGAGTYNGTTTLSAGTIRVGSSSTVSGGVITGGPVGTGTLALNGGTFQDNGTTRTIANPVTIGGNVTFSSSGSTGLTFDGTGLTAPATIALTGTPTLTVSNTTTFRNPVTGTTFTKAGGGTLVLDADNSGTITGVTVTAGRLQFNQATAIPGTSGRTVTAAAGGIITTGGSLTFGQGVVDRVATGSAGVIALSAASAANLDFSAFPTARLGATAAATYSGTLMPNGTTYRLGGGGGTLTVSSVLGGVGNTLNVGNNGTATGAVVLSNAGNAFTGVTVDGGVLQASADAAAGSATSQLGAVPATATDNITLLNGGLLRYGAVFALTSTRTVVLGTGGGGFDTNGNDVSVTSAFSGTGPLIKAGGGTLSLPGTTVTLPGLSTIGGTLNLNAGTTVVNGPVALANNAASNTVVPAGSTLDVQAGGSTFTFGNRTSAAGSINDLFDASAAQGVSITAATVQIGSASGSPDHTGTGPALTFTLPAGATSTATINATTSVNVGLGENNGDGLTTVNLGGGTNTIRTPLLSLGEDKTGATVRFPAGSGGSLSLQETGGDGKTNVVVGENPNNGTGTNSSSTLDLTTTGTVTASLGTLTLANTTNNSNTGGGSKGTFTLAATGTGSAVTADTVALGANTTGTTQATTSTFNLSAGAFTFNAGGTGFVQGAGTVTNRTTAVNVSGGTLDMNGLPINAVATGSGTSTLALTGGTITNASTIGSFTTLTFTGGTLRNPGTVARSLTQNGSGSTLDVAANDATIGGAYTLTAGRVVVASQRTLNVAGTATIAGTLASNFPGGATPGGRVTITGGGLDLSAATDALDVRATGTGQYVLASYTGTVSGSFDTLLLNGVPGDVAQGGPTQSYTGPGGSYTVTYDANQIVVNVTAVPEPAAAGLLAVGAVGLLARRRRPRYRA